MILILYRANYLKGRPKMKKKVTMEDIARALDLSRNTVIKALNNHSDVSETTKKAVLEKAVTLGYKKINSEYLGMISSDILNRNSNIAVIMRDSNTEENSYWMSVIKGIQEAIAKKGFNMISCFQNAQDEKELKLPQCIANGSVNGIIIDGAIKKEYVVKIISQGIPAVLIDCPNGMYLSDIEADIVMMENEESVSKLTQCITQRVSNDIGFFGDINSCRSFMERWNGFKKGLEASDLKIDADLCILSETSTHYQNMGGSEVKESLEKLKRIPRAIVCANDRIAISTIMVLREKGIRVPEDVMVAGFDDIQEATIIEPALTTVSNPKHEIGIRAGEEILWRIKKPNRFFEIIRIKTNLVFRKSTNN
jgi:LacI family transcriptional regulator